MPIVRLRDGEGAPFLACWLDDFGQDVGRNSQPLHRPVEATTSHLSEGGISAALSSGSLRHPHSHGHVLAYIGSEHDARFTLNLRGSYGALDGSRMGIAVEIRCSGGLRPLRFNCQPETRPRDDREWGEKIFIRDGNLLARALQQTAQPTIVVHVASLQDQEHSRSELENVIFTFEYRVLLLDHGLSSLTRVSCPLPQVVLRPADEAAAACVFPPPPLVTRTSIASREYWPYAVGVEDNPKRKGQRSTNSSSRKTASSTRKENDASASDADQNLTARSAYVEQEGSTASLEPLKVSAVRLAEERQARASASGLSLSIRGAASRSAAAQEAEAKIQEAHEAEERALRRQARQRRYEEWERERRHERECSLTRAGPGHQADAKP